MSQLLEEEEKVEEKKRTTSEEALETIELKLDEENELVFKVHVEGTHDAVISHRLMLLTEDISYVFSSSEEDPNGEVTVVVPALEKKLGEGSYKAQLEVIVDERYFVPFKFNALFKRPVKCVVESVSVRDQDGDDNSRGPTKKKKSEPIVESVVLKKRDKKREAELVVVDKKKVKNGASAQDEKKSAPKNADALEKLKAELRELIV